MPKISYLAKLEFFIVSLLTILFMTLNKIENAFFELLRIALGTQEKMTVALNDAEWKDVAQMAVKQSVLGILFTAVETLPEEQRPYNDLYIDMYKWVDTIEQRNEHMNKLTASVSNRFRKDGFPNCILKGQGVALLYPKPLRRHSGDIDIWLKGERKDIIKYVRKIPNSERPEYHHIGFKLNKKDVIEVHFTPSYMFNIFKNPNMQRWFESQQDAQINNYTPIPNTDYKIPTPTTSFNVIYSLNHIFRHFFNGGIGVRHIIDYFYILNAYDSEHHTEQEKAELLKVIEQFNMTKFLTALSWILANLLGQEREKLLVEPNEDEGRFFLKEVFISGNFGKYDPQQQRNHGKKNLFTFFNNQARIMRFFSRYTEEVCWRPIVSIKNQIVAHLS